MLRAPLARRPPRDATRPPRDATRPLTPLRAGRRPLTPAPDLDGPRVRVGIVWAALLLPALFAGPMWMALLLAPMAALAALQASRAWRCLDGRRPPVDGLAGVGAAALVVAAAFGLVGVGIAVVVICAAVFALDRVVAARQKAGRVSARRGVVRTLVLTGVAGIAGASPVALRSLSDHGAVPALALCTYALVYDASSFLMGSGSQRRWEGIAAGMASIGAVTVAVAAILSPPFKGVAPWALGVCAACLAPMGPALATVVLGDRADKAPAKAPALRRLDTFIVLGPIWTALALLFVG